ncbi:RNA polymerase sigma factor [Streptomyces cavernicola]|uniref:Sigma factor n=1 Tax=Streptomyces cavernicola TaxID=3043613 RepID=A0ABT6SI38_9ACTN|nr:sigma factor [Streptomyces sp. B-S-A6]MDI3407866.1 sigma factor [Streptomyces sp. B-S-A6]
MRERRRVRHLSADDLALSTAVARAQDGDEAAFSALYRSVHPGLDGYLRGLLGDEADDVAAAVWREIAGDLPRFRGDGPGFRGWTASIARRHLRGHLRRHSALPRSADFRSPLAADHAGHPPRGAVVPGETARSWIARLPRAQAEVILLRHVVRLDEPATARVLGRPVLVVRTLERRGLRSLARLLDTSHEKHHVGRTLGEPG